MVPPQLTAGCWPDAPALVDIYTARDTIWTIAERPNGATLPRFAAGLTRGRSALCSRWGVPGAQFAQVVGSTLA